MKNKKNIFKYFSEFPAIVILVVAIIMVILGNIYLTFKPYSSIYKSGYMVLSSNMTYNLLSNSSGDDLNLGATYVKNGDYVYKQSDSYFVGEEKKQEIDYTYPIYSNDGLTIYNNNSDVVLIDKNFKHLEGYSGLSINFGTLYNDGDLEPADNIDYIFLSLNNSVFINTQVISIKTNENEYNISVNSPVYFNIGYINYYSFDGKNFIYNKIKDISYDSIVTIGDTTLTYEEFLLKMGLIKVIENEEEDNSTNDGDQNIDGNTPGENSGNSTNNNQITNTEFVKPTVTLDTNFKTSVYSTSSNITINDPAGVITTYPTFELYKDEELVLRKKVSNSGEFTIAGLEHNTEYKMVVTFEYKNFDDREITSNIYEGTIKTLGLDTLEKIDLETAVENIYSDKAEINLSITNKDVEAVRGVSRIEVVVTPYKDGELDEDSKKIYVVKNLSMNSILSGNEETVELNNLNSNTDYNYKIYMYDKSNNELGFVDGNFKTLKKEPTVKVSHKDVSSSSATVVIQTDNPDDIIIKDYRYVVCYYDDYDCHIGNTKNSISTGNVLDLENGELKLDTMPNSDYRVEVTGYYYPNNDDTKEQVQVFVEDEFTTRKIENFRATNLDYTTQASHGKASINSTIGLSIGNYPADNDLLNDQTQNINNFGNIIKMDNTKVVVSLRDLDGNIADSKLIDKSKICCSNVDSKLIDSCSNNEDLVDSCSTNAFKLNVDFDGLDEAAYYYFQVDIVNGSNLNETNFNYNLLTDDIIYATSKINSSVLTAESEAYVSSAILNLYGNTLYIDELEITDASDFIYKEDGKYNIHIYIYEENSSNTSYVYHRAIAFERKDNNKYVIEPFTITNLYMKNYKFVITAKSKNTKQEKELSIEGSEVNYKTITKNDVSVEMFEQKDDKTTIQVLGYSPGFAIKLNNENLIAPKITELGKVTIDYGAGVEVISNENCILKLAIDKTICSYYKDDNVDDNGNVIDDISDNNVVSVEYKNKELASFDFDGGREIKNISSFNDLKDARDSDKNLNGHYVVTVDGLINGIVENGTGITNLIGSIDFQGHYINMITRRNKQNIASATGNLIYNLGETSELKNVVINHTINMEERPDQKNDFEYKCGENVPTGIVRYNQGKISNVIINVNQETTDRICNFGLLSFRNTGTIEKFAVYLNSNIYISESTGFIVIENSVDGVIENGYVSTNKFKLDYQNNGSDNSVGIIAQTNYGSISNVYNLASIDSYQTSSKIGTIVGSMKISGLKKPILKNTISSTTNNFISNSTKYGPNIGNIDLNLDNSNVTNNYYTETGIYSYFSDFNIKLDLKTLSKAESWKLIFDEGDGSETLEVNKDIFEQKYNNYLFKNNYYPILKMNSFVQNKQILNRINVQSNNVVVDVLDVEVNSSNNNISNEVSLNIKLYNPSGVIIDKILIPGLTENCSLENEYLTRKSTESGIEIYNLLIKEVTTGNKNVYKISEISYVTASGIPGKVAINRVIDIDLYNVVNICDWNEDNKAARISKISTEIQNYINNDNGKNIFLSCKDSTKSTLELPQNFKLDADLTYSASIDGNGCIDQNGNPIACTLDFSNVRSTNEMVDRGYVINSLVDGKIENLKITNLYLTSPDIYSENGYYLGFIKNASNSKIKNINISGELNINRAETYKYKLWSDETIKNIANQFNITEKKLKELNDGIASTVKSGTTINVPSTAPNYIGGIVAWTQNSTIELSSIKNLNISSNGNYKEIHDIYIGGIAGYSDKSTLSENYAEKFNILNHSSDNLYGNQSIGGIVGYAQNSNVQHNYSVGTITSNYYNIGGIVGIGKNSTVTNNYNYLNITSSRDYIGGIIGHEYNKNSVVNNMNIGKLINLGTNKNFNSISENATNLQTVGNVTCQSGNNNCNINWFVNLDTNKWLYYNNFPRLKNNYSDEDYNPSDEEWIYTIEYKNSIGESICTYSSASNDESCRGKEIEIANASSIILKSNKGISTVDGRSMITLEEYIPNSPAVGYVYYKVSLATNADAYYSSYNIKINGTTNNLPVIFYRKIGGSYGKWEDIKDDENVLVKSDINISGKMEDITKKKINNLIGESKYKISMNIETENKLEEEKGLDTNNLNKITGYEKIGKLTYPLIQEVNGKVSNVKFDSFLVYSYENKLGLILNNNGLIENCDFSNIIIINRTKSSPAATGIIGINRGDVKDLNLNNIYVNGNWNVGSLIGESVNSTGSISRITGKKLYVNYITQDCLAGCTFYKNDNIGGLVGTSDIPLETIIVDDVIVKGSPSGRDVVNGETVTRTGSKNIGGVVGKGTTITKSKATNVDLTGNSGIGGLIGYATYDSYLNTGNQTPVEHQIIGNFVNIKQLNYQESTASNIGGLIGNCDFNNNNITIKDNVVQNSSLPQGGGLIGKLDNTEGSIKFTDNLAILISGANGGLIGELSTTKLNNITFGLSLYYKAPASSKNFNAIGNVTIDPTGLFRINSYNDFSDNFIDNGVLKLENYTFDVDGENFPYFKTGIGYPEITEKVQLPAQTFSIPMMLSSRRMTAMMSQRTIDRVTTNYDVYASDVDKINIEFSEVNSNESFSYVIGDYSSELMPITSRTYTISYDYKEPIEIYITNGEDYKTSTIKATDLRKTLSLVDNKTYYINNNLLYGEDKAITGKFINLYGVNALTNDGKIYNIITKQVSDANINYAILESKPIYSFTYNNKNIYTYYNYSIVDGVIKNNQYIVKNNVLNIIDNYLDNYKDSYIIDYYNNNDIQIILKTDGVLYSLKNNIKYPDDFENEGIKELYTDIYSSNNIVTIKYDSGKVYTFNYRTGEEIFTNVSKSDYSLLEFIKEEILSSNKNNEIKSISTLSDYEEIEILKSKIEDTSVDEAIGKIEGNNSSVSKKDNYVTVYNNVTKEYEVYSVENLLNEEEKIESETNKINKNYELVQFYSDSNKKENKLSISGIIVFTVSIISIVGALFLLIRHRKNTKEAL